MVNFAFNTPLKFARRQCRSWEGQKTLPCNDPPEKGDEKAESSWDSLDDLAMSNKPAFTYSLAQAPLEKERKEYLLCNGEHSALHGPGQGAGAQATSQWRPAKGGGATGLSAATCGTEGRRGGWSAKSCRQRHHCPRAAAAAHHAEHRPGATTLSVRHEHLRWPYLQHWPALTCTMHMCLNNSRDLTRVGRSSWARRLASGR